MPIDTSLFCKQCGGILRGGAFGPLWKKERACAGVCIPVQVATANVPEKSANGTTLNPSLMCEKALLAGTPILNGSSWAPVGDRSFANPVTVESPKKRMQSERQPGREIERKYRVLDMVSLNLLHHHISSLCSSMIELQEGTSLDYFWTLPGVDFVRLRENTRELTVKITDKEDITDRVECNTVTEDFYKTLEWARTTLGKEVGYNKTHFYIYYLPRCEVTIYEVQGYDQVFLEVEAGSIDIVDEVEKELSETITLKQEFKSLFQILFGDKSE